MRKILYCFTLLLFLFVTSCTKPQQGGPSKSYESHTLIIYMMGDNGLASFMDKNLNDILSARTSVPEMGKVAVFYDRGNYTRLLEIVNENGQIKQRVIKEFSKDICTADASFMEQVLDLAVEELPSETYGIVLSSHGGGWVPADIFDMHIADPAASARRMEAPQTKFFGQDGYVCMEIPDIVPVLEKYDFEYIMFDACFMASVEAMYDLRNSARYIIASSAEVVGSGFPYQKILPMFFDAENGLENICKEFMDLYRSETVTWNSATISLLDMQKMDALASAMKDAVSAATSVPDASELQAYEGMNIHCYFDLMQYVNALEPGKEVADKFQSALKDVTVFTDHTETFYSDYSRTEIPLESACGLTCHAQQDSAPETHEAYMKTAWAKYIYQ